MTGQGTLEFRLLGPLEARLENRTLSLGGVRQRGLLALLLLRANEVVSRDRLIDELWRDHAPATAANALATGPGRGPDPSVRRRLKGAWPQHPSSIGR